MKMHFGFAIALVGLFAALACAANASTVTCSIPAACAVFQNTKNGPGIHTSSKDGYGIRADSTTGTAFLGSGGSGAFTAPAIEGESTNSSAGTDTAGAFGLTAYLASTTPPAYGVVAFGGVGGAYGQTLYAGTSTSYGVGVEGYDGGTGPFNIGIQGTSVNGTAMLAEAAGSPSIGLISVLPIGLYALAEPTSSSSQAVSMEAEGNSYVIEARNTRDNTFAEMAANNYFAEGGGPNGSYTISDSGSEFLSGTLETSRGTYVRTRGADGTSMETYGARSTAPTVEDVGEAQLVNGRAFVALDGALANVIDRRMRYHVFLTPEADTNGLYVAQKTATGFVVREQRDGHGTFAFDYRLVAKPLDDDGARLPLAHPLVKLQSAGTLTARHRAESVDPLTRLQQKIGAAAVAKLIASWRANQASR